MGIYSHLKDLQHSGFEEKKNILSFPIKFSSWRKMKVQFVINKKNHSQNAHIQAKIANGKYILCFSVFLYVRE